MRVGLSVALLLWWFTGPAFGQILRQEPNTWVKRSPLKTAPVSPALGYEGSFGYDPQRKLLIRWAGHNQGGGGEQNAETWTFDPATAKWTLKEPNLAPPGVCCAQQNVFAPNVGRFLRFKAFSGSHGWQWFREIYLNNSSVWSYDLGTNTWRDMRTVPAPHTAPLRCASWDSDHNVVVVFGGEGSNEGTLTYDPYTNTWTRKHPPKEPPGRSGGNLAYDAAHKLHILFGSQFNNERATWAYDLAKNEWRDLQPKTMPPTDRNDAVLVYDEAHKVIVCVVNVFDKVVDKESVAGHHETWTFDVGKNEWTKRDPKQEPQGWGSRRRILAYIPDQQVTLLESYVNPTLRIAGVDREQQIWTYRAGPVQTLPPAVKTKPRSQPPLVEEVVVSMASATKAQISWVPSPRNDVHGYHVERAQVEPFSEDQIHRLRKDTPPLDPPSVGGFKAIGPFVRLTAKPIANTTFTDTTIDLTKVPGDLGGKPLFTHRFAATQLNEAGKPYPFAVYAYRVRAVNQAGEESGPGPFALTIPSSPQWVFSKEEKTTCQVKWSANPEKHLKGYRVYRMESPRINGAGQPVTRVTPEPIAGLEYSDTKAGDVTRRYWIVAVDALGQEGFPSAPVWHERQYKKFYEPFTGPWHQ